MEEEKASAELDGNQEKQQPQRTEIATDCDGVVTNPKVNGASLLKVRPQKQKNRLIVRAGLFAKTKLIISLSPNRMKTFSESYDLTRSLECDALNKKSSINV